VSFLGPCCPAPLYCIAVHDCLMLTERINDDDDDDEIIVLSVGNARQQRQLMTEMVILRAHALR